MLDHVVITQPIHPGEVERLRAAGIRVTDLARDSATSAADLAAATSDADAVICQLTDDVAAAALAGPRLRLVATVAAGYDNIDIAAAHERDICVTHTPGALTDATADLTVALMLAVARHLPGADRSVRDGAVGPWRLLWEPMGADVTGASLGVVGLGRIGRAVARRAHLGFGMRIRYTSRSDRPHDLGDAIAAERVGLEELLATSDFVTLHAPATPQTRHLLDERTLAGMRPEAIVVNTARGSLVDEGALGRALSAGRLAGAGLDVLEHEPHPHPDLLAAGDRVVLTPHIGSATTRTRAAMAAMAVDDVLRVHAGLVPRHPVTA